MFQGKTMNANAISLKATEINATEIINFPVTKLNTFNKKEINIIPWTNEPYETNKRNRKANEDSLACKRKGKDKITEFLCGVGVYIICMGVFVALFIL